MSRSLLRLTVLAALLVLAILPVSAAVAEGSINSVSCNSSGFVVVSWTTGIHETDYHLTADESGITYTLPFNASGSTTTVWSGGKFHVRLSYGTGPEPTLVDEADAGCARLATGEVTETGSGEPPAPPPHWEGWPDDFGYDGRINATMADRYAVYCKAGQLQVWDSVTSSKVAAISYDDIRALDNPDSVAIGDGVALGSSNNTLMVVGPGSFSKDNIDKTRCLTGDYRGRNDR